MSGLGAWGPLLEPLRSLPVWERVAAARAIGPVWPAPEAVLRALMLTPLDTVRVVILGQDPYHGAGEAHGLCFSVPDGVACPPSLRNIFAEIDRDLHGGERRPHSTDLSRWARQGVLLLNSVLTVTQDAARSHHGYGWQAVTEPLLQAVAAQSGPCVFLLWGADAQRCAARLPRAAHHLYLEASHPSPLSVYRGFDGCGHFSAANAFLREQGCAPIDWD